MSKAAGRSVTIAPEKQQAHRSKGQRYFNSLVKQIENRRGRLAQEKVVGEREFEHEAFAVTVGGNVCHAGIGALTNGILCD